MRAKANEKMATGAIEVWATGLTVHSESPTPPFSPDEREAAKVNEERRLESRYIDLRRPAMQETLRVRSKALQAIRRVLDSHGFLEVETPVLTRATPEGSRDFLVPSRLVPGSFYALPQSPQIFKQILMVGGCGPVHADRPLLPRRGPAGRPPGGVHARSTSRCHSSSRRT